MYLGSEGIELIEKTIEKLSSRRIIDYSTSAGLMLKLNTVHKALVSDFFDNAYVESNDHSKSFVLIKGKDRFSLPANVYLVDNGVINSLVNYINSRTADGCVEKDCSRSDLLGLLDLVGPILGPEVTIGPFESR